MSGDGPTILVVDDEENVAGSYALWLEGEYRVETATSGEEALDALDESVAVILLDRRMPGLSGSEVLEELREREFDCRVALVTAVDPDFHIVDPADFDAYLTKPVDRDDLVGAVESLLTRNSYDEPDGETPSEWPVE